MTKHIKSGIGLLIGILAIGWFGYGMALSFLDVLVLGEAFGTLNRSQAVIVKKDVGARKSRTVDVEWRNSGEDSKRISTIGITVPYYDSLKTGDSIPIKFHGRLPGRVYSVENSTTERGVGVGLFANLFCFFGSIAITLVAYAYFQSASN